MSRPTLLALWSAPRSRSTAFERMMSERGDFTVLHEPFSHLADFGTTTLDGAELTSAPALIAALRGRGAPLFFKDTTDFHYPELLADREFLRDATHTFMIRHPREAIASHFELNPDLGRDEIGFAWLHEIFTAVADATGTTPVVVDSDDLLARPAETVQTYCAAVGIPFRPEALSWESGMDPGWERTARWHRTASEHATFAPVKRGYRTEVADSPVLSDYLRYHLPYYERLREHRIR